LPNYNIFFRAGSSFSCRKPAVNRRMVRLASRSGDTPVPAWDCRGLLDNAAPPGYAKFKHLLNCSEVMLLSRDRVDSGIPNRDLCDAFCPSGSVEDLRHRVLEVAGLSEIFRLLGDETRIKILYLLAHRELCVCDLASLLDMSLPAVSHHLRLLKALRLVKYRRDGKMVYYSLDDRHVLNLIREAQAHFAEGR